MAARKLGLALVVATAVALAGVAAQAAPLNLYEAPLGPGGTYRVYEVRGWGQAYGGTQTWYNAQQDAITRSYNGAAGNLVAIGSPAENDFVWRIANQEDVWIGLTDHENYGPGEGTFVWTSGEPVVYTNWHLATGEPSDSGGAEDAVHIWPVGGAAGTWNDNQSGIPGAGQDGSPGYRYVIEYPTDTAAPILDGAPAMVPAGAAPTAGVFSIREVINNGNVANLTDVRNSLISGGGTIVDYTSALINIHDSDGNGHFGGDAPFGVVTAGHVGMGGVEDAAFLARTQFSINSGQAGRYTIGFNSDDGGEVIIRDAGTGNIVPFALKAGDAATVITNYGSLAYDFGRPVNDSLGRIDLAAGDYTLEFLYWEDGGGSAVELFMAPGDHTSFNNSFSLLAGVPVVTDFKRLEAEDYNPGGEGVGYHDTSGGNSGGQYRTDDVDIEGVGNPSYGGYDVGWTSSGEWLKHDFITLQTGRYALIPRVAKDPDGASNLQLDIAGQSGVTGLDGDTGSWQDWHEAPPVIVDLGAGAQQLTTTWQDGNMNLDYIDLIRFADIAGTGVSRVEAEHYIEAMDTSGGNSGGQFRYGNVDIENSSNGTQDIGWTAAGEWIKNGVTISEAGRYAVVPLVASGAGGQHRLQFDIQGQTAQTGIPDGTGDWQNWVEAPAAIVDLTAGHAELTTTWLNDNLNLDYVQLIPYTKVAGAGIARVQAEDYIAFTDTTGGNSGGAYRQGDVDMEGTSGGGYNVGWTATGETLTHGITVAEAGRYALMPRVATGDSGVHNLRFDVDGQTAQTGIPDGTGGYQNWVEAQGTSVDLTAGHHQLTTTWLNDNLNLDYVQLIPYTKVAGAGIARVQAEDYIGYFDTGATDNAGGAYRQGGVDMENASTGTPNVGWTASGEWIRNGITVAQDGRYALLPLIASGAGGTKELQLDVAGQSGVVTTDVNAGWQTWTNTNSLSVDLTAGHHELTTTFVNGGINLDYVEVIPYTQVGQNPVRVQHEDYINYYDTDIANNGGAYRQGSVDIEVGGSSGYDVGWTSAGEWVDHGVQVLQDGRYAVSVVAGGYGDAIAMSMGGFPLFTFSGLSTGSWTTFRESPMQTLDVPAGSYEFRSTWVDGSVNADYLQIIPFKKVTQAGPTRVEAENFIAYTDTSGGNTGGAYRPTDVDIQAGGTNYNVGWTDPGETLTFGVTGVEPETYGFIVRAATPQDGRQISLDLDGTPIGTTYLLNTGGWQAFQDAPAVYAPLNGNQLLKTTFDNGGVNVDYIDIIPLTHAVKLVRGPGMQVIEAEAFHRSHEVDTGGPNPGGTDVGNDGGASGGQFVGWVAAGEWIAFDLLVAESGIHDIQAILATPNNARQVALYLDGILAETLTFDSTGGWGNYQPFALGRHDLSAGYHELRLLAVTDGLNFDAIQLRYIPEPATLALVGAGLLALRRRRRR